MPVTLILVLLLIVRLLGLIRDIVTMLPSMT